MRRDNTGKLFMCVSAVKAYGDERKIKQPVLIEKGEIVEFRYYSPANFRTIHNEYFCVNEKVFEDTFICVGVIWEKIRFENIATLEEILRLKLYEQDKEQRILIEKELEREE